jgi:hypothetical protein
MITFLAALSAGLLSAVIALIFGQPVQHHFWTQQREAERRLRVIDELNKLTAEFLIRFRMHARATPPAPFRIDNDFHVALTMAAHDAEMLFPAAAFQAYKRLEEMLGASTDRRIDDFTFAFVEARKAAFQALYKEVGIPSPSLWASLWAVVANRRRGR